MVRPLTWLLAAAVARLESLALLAGKRGGKLVLESSGRILGLTGAAGRRAFRFAMTYPALSARILKATERAGWEHADLTLGAHRPSG